MMKNKTYKIIFAALSLMTMASCTDSFLDKEPDERTVIDDVDKVIELFTSAYPDANYGWVCELSSDNVMDLNSNHLPASSQAKQETTHYNLTSSGRQDDEMFRFEAVKSSTSSDTPANVWTSFYDAINTVNEGLQALDEIATRENRDSKHLAARAEGLLIRAYCHFVLVNIFSQAYKNDALSKNDIGVPYVTEPIVTVDDNYNRSNVTDTYNKIRNDLEEGLKYVSNINYKKPKWHFSTDAAHAFAARFYLYTRQWSKVIEHANAVLGTNNEALLARMFDYTPLDDCTYLSDYANVWQNPDIYSNIMLIDTYSTIGRKARYRYAQGSLVARAIYYHNHPMWSRWAVNPAIIVSGLGGNGYGGYYPAWIAEQFQYTDKVAGIGYAHTIRREFTYAELLLERAEAKIMQNDLPGALEDLTTYTSSLQRFSPSAKQTYAANNGMIPLAESHINGWFARKTEANYNCFDDWNFVTNMSPDYVIPATAVPYMNCLNYLRRYETNFTGLRFFDLKRWGMEYTHEYGLHNEKYTLTWNDVRRAIEVPQDAIASGLEPSRPIITNTQSSETALPPSHFFGDNDNNEQNDKEE